MPTQTAPMPISDNRPVKKSTPTRNTSIDAIKFIAIIGVVLIHCCNYTFPVMSTAWITNIFFGSVLRCAVPLFLMCSGALLLPETKNLSVKSIFTKYLPRLIAAMIIWSLLYKVYHLLAADAFSAAALLTALKEVLMFNQEFHMYYMHIIIIVYLFLPITRAFVRNASRTELRYFICVWFAFGILYPTIRHLSFVQSFSGLVSQYWINMTYASIGFCVLGYYLKKYPLKLMTSSLSIVFGLITVFFGTLLLSSRMGAVCDIFWEGMSVGVFLSAVGIFGILCSRKSFGIFGGFITYMSKASFCIYLVHMFIVYAIGKLAFLQMLPQIICVPLSVLIVVAASTLVYSVLSHIPIVKRYLI